MRNQIFFSLCFMICLLSSNILSAQALIEKGLKGGINLARFIGDDADLGPFDVEREFTTKFAVGGFLRFRISEQFSFRPEAYYSVKGCHYKESKGKDEKFTITMNYIDIPLLGILEFVENFSLFAGPSMGIYLSGESKYEAYGETETEDIKKEDIKSLDFSLVFGVNYCIQRFHIDARYSLGLTNFPDTESNPEIKHGVIQMMLGFSF